MERTRQLIDTAFHTWWEDADGANHPFPVEYHSQPFTQPDSGIYGRLSILFGGVNPGAVGPQMDRSDDVLCLQIFLPEGANFADITAAVDKVRAFWRYKQFDDTHTDGVRRHLDFGNVDLTTAAARDGYKQFNVWASFRCDKYFPS